MTISAEWLKRNGNRIYPVSHAKTIVRGSSTVDADLTALETTVNGMSDPDTLVGSLSSLTTTAKTDVVSAINEIDGAINSGRLSVVNVQRLTFSNVNVATNAWTQDGDYYKATVALTGVTASMTPTVYFSIEDATSGVFLGVAESYAGGVYIYAYEAPSSAITISKIDCDLIQS